MKKLMVSMGIFTLVGSSFAMEEGFSASNAPKYDPKVTYACGGIGYTGPLGMPTTVSC